MAYEEQFIKKMKFLKIKNFHRIDHKAGVISFITFDILVLATTREKALNLNSPTDTASHLS